MKKVKIKFPKYWRKFYTAINIDYNKEKDNWAVLIDRGDIQFTLNFKSDTFFERLIIKNEPDWIKEKRERYFRPNVIKEIIE
jgi:hypothetical protein